MQGIWQENVNLFIFKKVRPFRVAPGKVILDKIQTFILVYLDKIQTNIRSKGTINTKRIALSGASIKGIRLTLSALILREAWEVISCASY